ncbi:MAG: hypothetical protein JXA71_13550 [Chitinispirillaceae bacterium]|nr:hypothetical protein [Chitinispirillaceae bacterium]
MIGESLDLRRQVQTLQERYDGNRGRILEIMTAENRKNYTFANCRVVRTEEVSIESVSKELLIQALKEVDIPREKKVFIWNHAMREVKRPSTVILQAQRNAGSATPGAVPGQW